MGSRGESMAVRVLLVLVAFAVVYGCGRASSPAESERQEKQAGAERTEPAAQSRSAPEPTTSSAGGTTVGEVVAEVDLRAVDDSGVSGTAVFKEVADLGVQVELEVSGLPDPGNSEEPEPYFAQVHEGSCADAPMGGDQERGEDNGDDYQGHDHGGSRLSLALLRPGLLRAEVHEYADHTEYEDPPADELPGNLDSPILVGASADGTGSVTSLLEGVKPEQLSSGAPNYVDLRAPIREAPEEWPLLACADLGEGD